MRDTVQPHAVLRDTHSYAIALSQLTARECGWRGGVPFPACPQTRKHGGWPPKYRSNARVSPDHGSEGEDVQLRWRPAHEENSDEFPAIKISRCSLRRRPNRTSSPGVSTAGPAGSAPMAITVLVVVQQRRAAQLKYLAATCTTS